MLTKLLLNNFKTLNQIKEFKCLFLNNSSNVRRMSSNQSDSTNFGFKQVKTDEKQEKGKNKSSKNSVFLDNISFIVFSE